MGLRRNNHCWDLFAKQFGIDWFYGGEIILSYGDWRIVVNSKSMVKEVWLSMAEPEDTTPVCCGDVSLVGAQVCKDHVVINAKIRSDVVVLDYWFRI